MYIFSIPHFSAQDCPKMGLGGFREGPTGHEETSRLAKIAKRGPAGLQHGLKTARRLSQSTPRRAEGAPTAPRPSKLATRPFKGRQDRAKRLQDSPINAQGGLTVGPSKPQCDPMEALRWPQRCGHTPGLDLNGVFRFVFVVFFVSFCPFSCTSLPKRKTKRDPKPN